MITTLFDINYFRSGTIPVHIFLETGCYTNLQSLYTYKHAETKTLIQKLNKHVSKKLKINSLSTNKITKTPSTKR